MVPRISAPHLALAAAVIGIWGSNFVVVRWGLDRLPPLALCTWRVFLSFAPACLLLRPPATQWRLLITVGVIMGVGQFGLLSIALQGHISPGLASVAVQTQAFFNVALAAIVLREQVKRVQVLGCLLAATGLLIIAIYGGTAATASGIVLVLLSALSWAVCNLLIKRSGFSGDLVSFITWSSLCATIPLASLSLLTEGGAALLSPVSQPNLEVWLILAWQAYANNLFGYAVWNGLIRSYSLAQIGPMTLLVPVVAIALSALLLHEELTAWKLAAAAFIIAGVAAPYASSFRPNSRRLP
jgi:O-acetylserine/cysteine efflux transporter